MMAGKDCQTCGLLNEKGAVQNDLSDIPLSFQANQNNGLWNNSMFKQIVGTHSDGSSIIEVRYKTSSTSTTWKYANMSATTISRLLERGYIFVDISAKSDILLNSDGTLRLSSGGNLGGSPSGQSTTPSPTETVDTPVQTNDGNFDPLGDFAKYFSGGIDVHITQPIDNSIKETQAAIDKTVEDLTKQFNLTIQQTQDAAAAAVAAANKAAIDGVAAATKAATDAATAAAAAAASGIDEGTKGLQRNLLIGGGIVAAVLVVAVVATRGK